MSHWQDRCILSQLKYRSKVAGVDAQRRKRLCWKWCAVSTFDRVQECEAFKPNVWCVVHVRLHPKSSQSREHISFSDRKRSRKWLYHCQIGHVWCTNGIFHHWSLGMPHSQHKLKRYLQTTYVTEKNVQVSSALVVRLTFHVSSRGLLHLIDVECGVTEDLKPWSTLGQWEILSLCWDTPCRIYNTTREGLPLLEPIIILSISLSLTFTIFLSLALAPWSKPIKNGRL